MGNTEGPSSTAIRPLTMETNLRSSLVKFKEEVLDVDEESRHENGHGKKASLFEQSKVMTTPLFPDSSKNSVAPDCTVRPLREKQFGMRKSSSISSTRTVGKDHIRRKLKARSNNNVLNRQRSSITACYGEKSNETRRNSIKSFLSSLASGSRTIDEQVVQQEESRGILCLRLFTFGTIIAAAAIVASLTFTLTQKYEMSEFETEYASSVAKVEEAIGRSIGHKLNTAKTFAALYTSRYGSDNVWPNVTMPDFQQIAVGQLYITSGIAMSYNPIINGTDQQKEFEAYAAEAADELGADELVERSCENCRVVADGVFRKVDGMAVDDSGTSPESRYPEILVPVWQIFPTKVNWRAVMFNLHSETNRQHALDDMLEYQVPTVTALLHLVQHDEMNPSSILFYPVFDHFVQEVEGEEQLKPTASNRRIKGSISIVFAWEDILRRVLPSYIEGLIVVLESSVASELPRQLWTYEVNGKEVSLLGEGDLHDDNYCEYEHIVNANVADDAEELGIVDHLITYQMRIYPSERFLNRHSTKRPEIMTGVVICIFVFTSLAFLLYDYLLKNRLNVMMSFASRSGKIVNSLFPENVRSRMMDNAHHFAAGHEHDIETGGSSPLRKPCKARCSHRQELERCTTCTASSMGGDIKNKISKKRKFVEENIKTMLRKGRRRSTDVQMDYREKNRLVRRSSSNFNAAKGDGLVNLQTPPIADLFQATSIMFADIVGFTEWSSNRSPDEVFHLLETLFFEFDRLATTMEVFKLGTIGDCYIAVTGIPDARDDHAEVLCQFAEGCRYRMNKVVSELHGSLDHVDMLSMRFGIHSGPVTAGVLRGQKSRFELFGDTINTASRMESNGLPNKIQVSQETADLLVQAGFEKWIKPRSEHIQAKGKGMLQTYWFETCSDYSVDESPFEVQAKTRTLKSSSILSDGCR